MTERVQLGLALASIVLGSAAVLWLLHMPDDPEIALGNSAGAALLASIVLLGKLRRDRGQ